MPKTKKTKIVFLGEEFSDYELEGVKKLEADWFVYNYEYGSWEGFGFAIWRRGENFFYSSLSHCSCYGPTENLPSENGVACTWDQILEVAKNYNYDKADKVVNYIIKKKLNA